MYQMELNQFEQLAKERRPDWAKLVRGRHWQHAARELFAVAAFKNLKHELLPQRDCLVAELYPIAFLDRNSGQIDDGITSRLGFTRVNRFYLVADLSRGKCRFGPPHGQIALDPAWRCFGMGGYLMAQMIAWGQDRYPSSAVTTEHLDLRQAEVQRPVLNGFCRRAGFDTIFHAQEEVTCFVKRMDLLNPDYNQERVAEVRELSCEEWFQPSFQGEEAVRLVREILAGEGR